MYIMYVCTLCVHYVCTYTYICIYVHNVHNIYIYMEREMATHSSVLAWRIPGKGEAGGLPSMGLQRVGHD